MAKFFLLTLRPQIYPICIDCCIVGNTFRNLQGTLRVNTKDADKTQMHWGDENVIILSVV